MTYGGVRFVMGLPPSFHLFDWDPQLRARGKSRWHVSQSSRVFTWRFGKTGGNGSKTELQSSGNEIIFANITPVHDITSIIYWDLIVDEFRLPSGKHTKSINKLLKMAIYS